MSARLWMAVCGDRMSLRALHRSLQIASGSLSVVRATCLRWQCPAFHAESELNSPTLICIIGRSAERPYFSVRLAEK